MRTITAILFLFLSSRAIAPDIKVLVIPEAQPINIYERLMMAVLLVESSGDTLAFNAFEEAYGPFQIRPIRLKDYNIRTGKNYVMQDCFKVDVSTEIFLYYARNLGPDYERIAKRWNGSGVKTIEYWEKVKANLELQEKGLIPIKFII